MSRLVELLLQREGRTQSDLDEARELAEYLVEQLGDRGSAGLMLLAKVHAEAGDFDGAVELT